MRFITIILIVIVISSCGNNYVHNYTTLNPPEIGEAIDSLEGVEVYYNGLNYTNSQGKNFSEDNYYYGQKGQCVEFVKRFYFDALNHKMPDVWGHAISFFDHNVKHGQLNTQRGLLQFYNNSTDKPQKYDLMVFPYSKYGHVAIVSEVTDKYIEVIQQNMRLNTRERYDLKYYDGFWLVKGSRGTPIGWLRKQ